MVKRQVINVRFMTCTSAELKAAERKKARLENAGYVLVRTTDSAMHYELEV